MSLHRIDNRPIPRSGGKCRVFIVCNNEEERLPHFFDGHRHLGVQRFFAVANNSADSPKDFLAKQRNWGKTPGKIVPNVDRSAPAQQGLAQSRGQRFVSGRMLRLGAWGFAPIAREVVDLFQALVVPPPVLVQLLLRTRKPGRAQVNRWRGRLDILRKLNKPVEHDVYYIRHWSLLLYRQILLRTMGCVFRDTSAV